MGIDIDRSERAIIISVSQSTSEKRALRLRDCDT